MTTTERLYQATADIWAGYHTHPFVQGIADGTLAPEKFQYYMIQDYVYLIDYAKVFAAGVCKARDMDTMRLFAQYVHQILDGEMDIHKGYLQRLNIPLEQAENTPAALDNLSYTSYMLRVAYEGDAADVAAAILSCAVSYEAIGKEIVRTHPHAVEHPFYGEWVRSYASDEYAQANRVLEALMNRLTEGASEEQLARLTEIFVRCSRYEGAFWDMAWEMRR